MGFLDCFKYLFLSAALFSEAMWGRGLQLSVISSLASLWSFQGGQIGHGPSPDGLISLSAYTSKEKTDSRRSRVPRWASSSESASVILTSALLPEYFWDLSNQLPLFWISFSQVVRCPGGLEPCCPHSFINGILASSWKKHLFKSAMVSGVLEMVPSQLPCPHPRVQLCISSPRPVPHHPFLSLALNLINRCKLNRLPESQNITWKAPPKVLQSFPPCHTVSSASVALSRHLSSLQSMLHLLMLRRNALQSSDVGSTQKPVCASVRVANKCLWHIPPSAEVWLAVTSAKWRAAVIYRPLSTSSWCWIQKQ